MGIARGHSFDNNGPIVGGVPMNAPTSGSNSGTAMGQSGTIDMLNSTGAHDDETGNPRGPAPKTAPKVDSLKTPVTTIPDSTKSGAADTTKIAPVKKKKKPGFSPWDDSNQGLQ